MVQFENKKIKGIYASRYVASWVGEGGNFIGVYDDKTDEIYFPFKEWLKSIPLEEDDGTISYMSNEDANYIYDFAATGKMELEFLAKDFFLKQKQKKD